MTLGLQATADSGYTFSGWTGNCVGTSTGIYVQLNGARTCGATFTSSSATVYRLNVTTPTGGTVGGGGITCGTGGTTCSVTYTAPTSVTLTATADANYSFTSWGGSCSGTSGTTTVTVDGIKTCTATFTAAQTTGPPYTMTISPTPTGGTVTGAGLKCGAGGTQCSVTMPAAMTLGLEATPASGYTFSGWTGNCSGTSAGIYVQLTGARTCGATFTAGGGTTP